MFHCYRLPVCVAFCLFALLCSDAAFSDVILKPSGQKAYPLRTKALHADVRIEGQFAATRLNFLFQNETANRIEADFLYTLPPDTIVTYFAYWYGDEKVVARIVEKERARAIYQYITSRMRDPALVEMVGKNTFRAKIFPVMPNADLKVEMVLMSVLPSEGRNIVYAFPLGDKKYDALDFKVTWRRGSGIERFSSNYGTNLTLDSQSAQFRLNATNFRPPKEVRVTATRFTKPLYVEIYAAPSGGRDGFFALALTPDRTLLQPRVRITGVPTSEVLPERYAGVKAGRALRYFGLYRGSGPATVTLTGASDGKPVSYTQTVHFGSKPVQNNLASKLWAWRRIEQLSASDSNRSAVIALSKRYLLPSKFTSWLAIPKAELERYKYEKTEAEISVVATQLARELLAGRERSAAARQLKAQLEKLCKQISYDPKSTLQNHLAGESYRIGQQIAAYINKGQGHSVAVKRLRSRLNILCRYSKEDPQDVIRGSLSEKYYRTAYSYAQEVENGQENSAKVQELRRKFEALCKQADLDPRKELNYQLQGKLMRLGAEIVKSEHGSYIGRRTQQIGNKEYDYVAVPDTLEGKPDLVEAAKLRLELERLTRMVGRKPQEYTQQYDLLWTEYAAWQVRAKLLAEHAKDAPDRQTLRQLETQLLALARQIKRTRPTTRRRILLAKKDTDKLDLLLTESQLQVASAKQRYDHLINQRPDLYVRMGDPLIQVDAPEDAEQVIALMPDGEVKRLEFNPRSRKWEGRFSIPTYLNVATYTITLLIVHKDGTRQTLTMRFQIDGTPPDGNGSALTVTPSKPTLRLEFDASPDTARVVALLPWNESVRLERSTETQHRFFALVPIPTAYQDKPSSVTFVLTDWAHNRTTITVDMEASDAK